MDCVLFQDRLEIKSAQEYFGENFERLKLVAWTPSAIDGLVEAERPYTTLGQLYEDPVDSDERDFVVQRYRDLCDSIDDAILKLVPEFRSTGVRSLGAQYHYRLHDSFKYFNEVDGLKQLIRLYKPSRIFYFSYSSEFYSPLSEIIGLITTQRCWPTVFESLKPSWPISGTHAPVRLFHDNRIAQEKTNLIKAKNITENSVWDCLSFWFKTRLKSQIAKRKYRPSVQDLLFALNPKWSIDKRNSILVLNFSPEVEAIIDGLSERSETIDIKLWGVFRDKKHHIRFASEEIIDGTIEGDQTLRAYFVREGVDIFTLMYPEFKKAILAFTDLYRNALFFEQLAKKHSIKLVLASHELPICEAIFQVCEQMGIPRIVTHHGGGWGCSLGNNWTGEQLRRGSSLQIGFVYGKSAKAVLEERKKTFGCKTRYVVTGSSVLMNLHNQSRNNRGVSDIRYDSAKPKVCFVLGPFGYHFVNSKRGVLEDACQYRFLRNLVEVFAHGTCRFLVKSGYEAENYGLDLFAEIKAGVFPNVELHSSQDDFLQMPTKPQVVILNHLSSALFEVLATSTPLVVLADRRAMKLPAEVEGLLRRRAKVFSDAQDFLDGMTELSQSGFQSSLFDGVNNEDTTFFEQFCWDRHSAPGLCGAKWIMDNIFSVQ